MTQYSLSLVLVNVISLREHTDDILYGKRFINNDKLCFTEMQIFITDDTAQSLEEFTDDFFYRTDIHNNTKKIILS